MENATEWRRGDGLRAALLIVIVGGAIPAAQAFREDEIECEETAAFLQECCPDVDLKETYCKYDGNCGTTPDLTAEESRCLRELSCDDVRAAHVCENLGGGQHARYSESNAEVCK